MKPVFHLIKRYGVSNNSPHKTLQGLPRTPFCPVLVFQPLPPEIYAHLAFRRSRPRNQRRRKGAKKRVAINQRFGNQEIGKSVLWERNKTTCTICGSNRSRSNATGLMLGVKMRSGHSKLLVQGERSVRMSSPQSHTHTNISRLKQPHGILTL